ncbi:MAG TPA: bifunctional diguanylate cyclase/phosphodiesterase [Candidatus Baltobacteraceae bacterium]|nr:bifunctional diguanylate cyclase/phosphodiesterase [Candidatus Baltobacteraceae bacterium]
MERPPERTPSLRASLGILITAIAAVLLAFACLKAVWLNAEAVVPAAQLSREQAGVQFERILFPLVVDLTTYRTNRQLLTNDRPGGDLRGKIDREMREGTKFATLHDPDLNILSAWGIVRKDWKAARDARAPYHGHAIAKTLSDLLDQVIYRVEDTTGLGYEPNKFAQDLGDLAFAKLAPAASYGPDTDLLTENAFAHGSMTIPERIRLARHIGSLGGGGGITDLETDDWSYVLAHLADLHMGTAADASTYAADAAAFTKASQALADYANAHAAMLDVPRGDPLMVRKLTAALMRATQTMHNDTIQMLDRSLSERMALAQLRNNYLYLIVLFGAALLVGLLFLAAELTALRDRRLLTQATQESERLGAELARRNAERALRLSEAQFRAIFDGAAMGIAVLDRSGSIIDSNSVFRAVYGDNAAGVLEGHENEFAELMRGERDLFEFEQHVMTPSGQEAWTDSTATLVNDETGKPYFAMVMFRDLTDLKRNERRMQHDLTHDALTGLPNRASFEAKVREQFEEAKARPQSSFAVLYVDLDRFKDINESLGHDAGDFVIAQVGHRLRAAIESADVVARLGSDEFAVLVRSLPDVLHVEVIARRVLTALAKPVALGTRSIFISGSVGIALASTGYVRGEDVMRDADIAMRYAKSGGGGRFAVFDSKMHARAEKRLQLTTDLRLALERAEFDLHYQPIVRIADGELVGCEALLRWNHPVEGVMLPMEFMPLAEQTALAVPIGRFVLRTACQQLSRWRRALGQRTPFPINVNVSAAELLDPDFENVLNSAVREFGVNPADLMLEITESVVLDAGTRPNALVERLRATGFRICIDDFGTGYSSLRYLQQFKVDSIKIDRSFVSGQDGDVASEPIVRTLMTLAEAFDVRVVAEGIETPRQRDVLRNAGCRYGQGYFYAKALSADQLTAMYPATFGLEERHASA